MAAPTLPDLKAGDFQMRHLEVTLSVDLVLHPEVLSRATEDEFARTHYSFVNETDVLEHLLFNLLQGRRLSQLDGWADLPGVAAFVETVAHVEITDSDPREVPAWLPEAIARDLATWRESEEGT